MVRDMHIIIIKIIVIIIIIINNSNKQELKSTSVDVPENRATTVSSSVLAEAAR